MTILGKKHPKTLLQRGRGRSRENPLPIFQSENFMNRIGPHFRFPLPKPVWRCLSYPKHRPSVKASSHDSYLIFFPPLSLHFNRESILSPATQVLLPLQHLPEVILEILPRSSPQKSTEVPRRRLCKGSEVRWFIRRYSTVSRYKIIHE